MYGEIENGLMIKNKMDQSFKMRLQNKYLKPFVYLDVRHDKGNVKQQIANSKETFTGWQQFKHLKLICNALDTLLHAILAIYKC